MNFIKIGESVSPDFGGTKKKYWLTPISTTKIIDLGDNRFN
jgi:hypothetical protein